MTTRRGFLVGALASAVSGLILPSFSEFVEGTIFAKVAAALQGMRSAPGGAAAPARLPTGDPVGEVDRAADPLRPS